MPPYAAVTAYMNILNFLSRHKVTASGLASVELILSAGSADEILPIICWFDITHHFLTRKK